MSVEQEILTLKSRINELEDRLQYIYQHLHIAYSNNPEEMNRQVIEILKTRNKIEAIKAYREIHNVGLAEAKQAVDAMESRL